MSKKKLPLKDIEALVASGELDSFLDSRGVPDFKEDAVPEKPRKFGKRKPFDRATFDIELYNAEILRELDVKDE
jgi:hypothetical protein